MIASKSIPLNEQLIANAQKQQFYLIILVLMISEQRELTSVYSLSLLKSIKSSNGTTAQINIIYDNLIQLYNLITKMDLDIYTTTKNWQFTALDQLAQEKFSLLEEETRNSAPQNFYHKQTLTHLEFIKNSSLYPHLQTLPKAVLHHLHFDCAEDQQFYRLYVINDPRIYLAPDRKQMRIGTKQQAQLEGWIAMSEERKKFQTEQAFVKSVSSITMLNKEELLTLSYVQKEMWDRFQQKISNFFVLVFTLDIFKAYTRHVLLKYIKNGYDRIQFRAFLCKLKQYDGQGNFIKEHHEKKYMQAFDQVYNQVRKQHPQFTVGFVLFGLKFFSAAMNEELFTTICQLNWDKTIGLDFVQQQDLFGSLQQYDPIVDKVLEKYPHLNYKKVYHAGQTKDHRTHNLQVAVKAGSVRIGHGFNILQRIQFLPHCRNICFEKNPLSNLVLGYNSDSRQASAPILLGLGYAVTINPDDPGKFGVEDTTVDYFLAAISYNWTLRHLKLIAYHSINHAICDENTRANLLKSFNKRWNQWVLQFVGGQHLQITHKWLQPDIYTGVRRWSWNQSQSQVSVALQKLRQSTIDTLPQGFYQEKVLSHLKYMRGQQLYKLLKTIPKGTLHHDHFDCNQDQQFYLKHIITDPRIYLSKDKKSFQVGTTEQAIAGEWHSWKSLLQEFKDAQALADYLYTLTSFSEAQMLKSAGNARQFWPPFQDKITNFNKILEIKDVFIRYSQHILRKYIANGYERVQFRALLIGLKQYDNNGRLVAQYGDSSFTSSFDYVYQKIRKQYPLFSVGFIFFGLKCLSDVENKNILRRVCNLNWHLTVGIDFVQQQDPFGSLQRYDAIADQVLGEFPNQWLRKCYHAGDTRDHTNKNVQLAIKAGSARIGHGLNVVQHIQILPICTGVCFQLCPVSNLITASSARLDLRLSNAPILLGLGIPVSINPDDPGKFGYQDSTVDYFCAAVSFNWTLKHLKLIAIHSINHAICSEGTRVRTYQAFQKRWKEWIHHFLNTQTAQ